MQLPLGDEDWVPFQWRNQFWQGLEEDAGKRCSECEVNYIWLVFVQRGGSLCLWLTSASHKVKETRVNLKKKKKKKVFKFNGFMSNIPTSPATKIDTFTRSLYRILFTHSRYRILFTRSRYRILFIHSDATAGILFTRSRYRILFTHSRYRILFIRSHYRILFTCSHYRILFTRSH